MVTRLWLLIKTSMEKINPTLTLYYHLILDTCYMKMVNYH